MFVNSAWYAAGFSDEIGAGLLGRVICGEPVVLYRSGDGTPVVLEDLCCHRMLPLSKGRREGDCVRCGYHGLRFDPRGICVEVPGMAVVPPRAQGIEVRGTARALPGEGSTDGGLSGDIIRLTPTRIVSWGIDSEGTRARNA